MYLRLNLYCIIICLENKFDFVKNNIYSLRIPVRLYLEPRVERIPIFRERDAIVSSYSFSGSNLRVL